MPNEDAVAAERLGLTVDELRDEAGGDQGQAVCGADASRASRSGRQNPDSLERPDAGEPERSGAGVQAGGLSRRGGALRRIPDFADDDGEGRLWRTSKDGKAHISGYLEDYAALIDAFLELYQTTFDERWFNTARQLADTVLARFRAPDGGFSTRVTITRR